MANTQTFPPTNNTERYLDAILAEMRVQTELLMGIQKHIAELAEPVSMSVKDSPIDTEALATDAPSKPKRKRNQG
jgi:hypothetical protein